MYPPKLLLMLSSSLILILLLILVRDFNGLVINNLNSGDSRLFFLSEIPLTQAINIQAQTHLSGCNCPFCG
ncbi:MAG: hypothetical protein QNJ64_15260 [Crocosphaera sp.]|nr:hypothetical protein [Crocosphaera sp.]